ncbi:PAS domain S-box protein [Polaromonas sp.]|uniref:sensor histidine kinase n=1 Tax=Polaromonas sp. TaxID=1869339 RepID=UPI0032649B0F
MAGTPTSPPGEALALLQQIASNIDAMLWSWDPQNGRISYTNPAFEAFWGLSANTLADEPWQWLEHVESADRERVRSLQTSPVKRSEEYKVIRPQGGTARLSQRALPMHSPSGELLRIIHLANNITWQLDTSKQLRVEIGRRTDSEAKYRAVVENVSEGILVTAAGRILYANPKALELTSLDEETAKSRPFIEFIHPDDREKVLGNHMKRLRGETVENYYQFRVQHSQVATRWLEISAVMFEWQGAPATLNFLTDVTLKRQAEEDMRKALAHERELSELKSRFVAVASHEFRTPLAAILSSVELLDTYGASFPAGERRELLGQIKTAVARMNGMVEQVLLTSRLELGKFRFEAAPLLVPDWLVQVMDELERGSPQATRISLTCDGLDAARIADQQLLRYIVINLLSNALKYSNPDTPVQFAVRGVDDQIHLRVSDQGIGIPEADLPRLFGSFHRGSNVGNISGTGIGLHIVKECVTLHGGDIEVNSQLGLGTTFTVRLAAPPA